MIQLYPLFILMFGKMSTHRKDTCLGMWDQTHSLAAAELCSVMVVQILLIKNLFATLGKHVMLVVGNLLLAGGMVSAPMRYSSEGFRHVRTTSTRYCS